MLGPTPTGRRALQKWLRTPVSAPRELRAAFVAKLYLAMQRGPGLAHTLLNRQRRILQRRLQREAPLTRGDPAAAALGIRSAQTQAALDYLDELEIAL
jgi:hypothetical protein